MHRTDGKVSQEIRMHIQSVIMYSKNNVAWNGWFEQSVGWIMWKYSSAIACAEWQGIEATKIWKKLRIKNGFDETKTLCLTVHIESKVDPH